jgi:hypothetical protein
MKTSKLLATLGIGLTLIGCSENNISNEKYESQSISLEGKAPVEKLDRNTLQAGNGFNVDFNGDGIIDLVSMRGSQVYFSDGKNKKEIEIARITVPVIAYSIRTSSEELPYLVFFDQQENGYKQENLGPNKEGIPMLGDIVLETPTKQ